jgi:hypothetical protein
VLLHAARCSFAARNSTQRAASSCIKLQLPALFCKLAIATLRCICHISFINNGVTDMTTATHNGTCQACGRQHAVNVKSGKLAKHGYTVDWGFFNGTCSGSDHLPLEKDTSLNVAIIEQLTKQAAQLDIDAEGEILKVAVEVGHQYRGGRRVAVTQMMDRAEFEATQPRYRSFDDAVELLRTQLRRQAELFRSHAADLDRLRESRHGQPLIARPVEAPIQREYFGNYRDAYARVQALKAEGRDARQRREQWGSQYVVTYR